MIGGARPAPRSVRGCGAVRAATPARRRGRSCSARCGRRAPPDAAPRACGRGCRAPPGASTTATSACKWNSSPSARSLAKVCNTGPGSARPLVSMMTRWKLGTAPRARSANRVAQALLQVGAHGAAQAAVAEQHGGVARRAQQRVVDPDFAVFVDDDGGVGALRLRQQLADQRRLAGAEKPGDDGDRDARAARPPLPPPEPAGVGRGEELANGRPDVAQRSIHEQKWIGVSTNSLRNPFPARRGRRRGGRRRTRCRGRRRTRR